MSGIEDWETHLINVFQHLCQKRQIPCTESHFTYVLQLSREDFNLEKAVIQYVNIMQLTNCNYQRLWSEYRVSDGSMNIDSSKKN